MQPAMPGNETREHFLLKQVSLIWLKIRGSQFVGTEIDGMWGGTNADWSSRTVVLPKRTVYGSSLDELIGSWSRRETEKRSRVIERPRSIADVVGAKRVGDGYEVRTIEVKVSRQDFLSGYCTGGNFSYVMTPPGLIEPSELEAGVGLLEADLEVVFDKLRQLKARGWSTPRNRAKEVAKWVSVERRPTRKEFLGNPIDVIESIAVRATNEYVYKNPYLDV